jgi:hypothetical protein
MIDKAKLQEWVADFNEEALFANGCEEAIVGVAERCGQPALVVYDVDKVLEILARDMTKSEAVEFFNFNVIGAWMGENTPLFLSKYEP